MLTAGMVDAPLIVELERSSGPRANIACWYRFTANKIKLNEHNCLINQL